MTLLFLIRHCRRLFYHAKQQRHDRMPFHRINAYHVQSITTTYSVDDATRSVPDNVALEIQNGELDVTICSTCNEENRDTILSRKIARLLELEATAVLIALTAPLDKVRSIFIDLHIIPDTNYSRDTEPEEETRADHSRRVNAKSFFSFNRPSSGHNFTEAFNSNEDKLRAAGHTSMLAHSQTYQMDYKSGSLKVAANKGCVFHSHSHVPPPVILRDSSESSGASNDEDATRRLAEYETETILGEFLVSNSVSC